MSSPCTQLPAEVWSLVFAHLCLADSLRVRATCRDFRELVDRSTVWRKCTVKLTGKYDKDFWHTVQRWRVTSARLSSSQSWKCIAKELPGLTSLTLDCHFPDMKALRIITNLERLYIPQPPSHDILYEQLCLLPPQLTHLSVCCPHVWMYNDFLLPFQVPDHGLPFSKLKSFVCHYVFRANPVDALYFILCCLPQLEHLSLATEVRVHAISFEAQIPDLHPLHNCALVSLELLACDLEMLPMDFSVLLSTLPFLRSLAIHCWRKYDHFDEETRKLSAWLSALPLLSSLLVSGVEVTGFVQSIPSSVTRLILMPDGIQLTELELLSAQLPNLLHLHLEPLRLFVGSKTANIPRLFPGLRSLHIFFFKTKKWSPSILKQRRRLQLSEKTFLSLASLKDLELLEMLDEELPPTVLISKLRELTQNRVRISLRPQKDQMSRDCHCTPYVGRIRSTVWPTE